MSTKDTRHWTIADSSLGEHEWVRRDGRFDHVRIEGVTLQIGPDDIDGLRPTRCLPDSLGCATCNWWLPGTFRFCLDCGARVAQPAWISESAGTFAELSDDAQSVTRFELPRGAGFQLFTLGNPRRLFAWELDTGSFYRWSATRAAKTAWEKIFDSPPLSHSAREAGQMGGAVAGQQTLILATEEGPLAVSFPTIGRAISLKKPAKSCKSIGAPSALGADGDAVYVPVIAAKQLCVARWDAVLAKWSLLEIEKGPAALPAALGAASRTASGDIVWPSSDGYLGVRREMREEGMVESAVWLSFVAETRGLVFLPAADVDGAIWQPTVSEFMHEGQTTRSRSYTRLNPRTTQHATIEVNAHALSAGSLHLRKSERLSLPWDEQAIYAVPGDDPLLVPIATFDQLGLVFIGSNSAAYPDYMNNRVERSDGDICVLGVGGIRSRIVKGVQVASPTDFQFFRFASKNYLYLRTANELWAWAA